MQMAVARRILVQLENRVQPVIKHKVIKFICNLDNALNINISKIIYLKSHSSKILCQACLRVDQISKYNIFDNRLCSNIFYHINPIYMRYLIQNNNRIPC